MNCITFGQMLKAEFIALLLLLIPVFVQSQPVQGQPIPKLVLTEDEGGKLGGGTWRCSDMKGKPCLLVLIHPDKPELLAPVEKAISDIRLHASEGALVKVMDTDLSWKPFSMIQAGAWFGHATVKFNEAREHGLVQALFTDRKNKPASWSIVYDQNQVFRNALRLNDRPVHIFLLDKRGIIVSYTSGKPSEADARTWIQIMKKLSVNS